LKNDIKSREELIDKWNEGWTCLGGKTLGHLISNRHIKMFDDIKNSKLPSQLAKFAHLFERQNVPAKTTLVSHCEIISLLRSRRFLEILESKLKKL